MEELELLCNVDENIKWYKHFRKSVNFFKKLNLFLTYDPASLSLGIHPREMKACIHNDLYTSAYGAFIYNSQKLETTQISIRGKDKL